MPKGVILFISFLFFYPAILKAQNNVTSEDSLHKSSDKSSSTYVGGYGDLSYQRDFNAGSSEINLNRAVIFIGHKFNGRISVFSEFEVEDAKIAGGDPGGEFAIEQAYLKFNFNKNIYLTAGLFTPRIGLINENHLPSDFNGTERPLVEKVVIPATWRELGVGIYGHLNKIPLNFSFAVCNGLNSAAFEHGTGIREGRFEGRNATANNLAITASLQYYAGGLRFQLSGYSGGTVGLSPREADSLQLESGMFGTPVSLGEANIKYEHNGFCAKALGTFISISDAHKINQAYASNTPEAIYGGYIEIAYNLFETFSRLKAHQFILFARYEKFDLNDQIPANGIIDMTLKQDHIIAGITYLPIRNVVIKADVRIQKTGDENKALVINPSPTAPAYKTQNTFLNIGIGYAF